MSWLLYIHLTALGVWLGLVLVESIMELQKSPSSDYDFTIAKVHQKVDAFCEVPAFMTVLITGFMMLQPSMLHGWFLVKVICGTFVIAVNMWCVTFVVRRGFAAKRGDLDETRRLTRWIMITVPIGAPFAVIALVIGLSKLIV
jgi:uncharacterized membrane protein